MALSNDKQSVINQAMSMIGGSPVSLNDEVEATAKAMVAWDQCVAHCFGLHDWSFARRTTKLTRSAETPNNGWKYQFTLSGDSLGPPLKVLANAGSSSRPLRNFTLEGKWIFANELNVWVLEKVFVDPLQWDPQWNSAFVVALQSFLAVPFTHDTGSADKYWAMAFGTPSEGGAGGMFGRLIAQDRAGAPVGSNMYEDNPISEGRSVTLPWHGRF